jgi:hypothetical protein
LWASNAILFHLLRLLSRLTPPSVSPHTHTVGGPRVETQHFHAIKTVNRLLRATGHTIKDIVQASLERMALLLFSLLG